MVLDFGLRSGRVDSGVVEGGGGAYHGNGGRRIMVKIRHNYKALLVGVGARRCTSAFIRSERGTVTYTTSVSVLQWSRSTDVIVSHFLVEIDTWSNRKYTNSDLKIRGVG